jgi:hypothetical protein
MNGIPKAIPTDYRGIRFRSRTEAIQIQAIDFITSDPWSPVKFTTWQYEPDIASFFKPDILLKTDNGLRLIIELKSQWPDSESWHEWFQQCVQELDVDGVLLFTGSKYHEIVVREFVDDDLRYDKQIFIHCVMEYIWRRLCTALPLAYDKFRPEYDPAARADLFDHSPYEIGNNIRMSQGMINRLYAEL